MTHMVKIPRQLEGKEGAQSELLPHTPVCLCPSTRGTKEGRSQDVSNLSRFCHRLVTESQTHKNPKGGLVTGLPETVFMN